MRKGEKLRMFARNQENESKHSCVVYTKGKQVNRKKVSDTIIGAFNSRKSHDGKYQNNNYK